jgi:hypothetical protein
MPKAEFQREVEKLTGKDSEPSELIYFKVYKSQTPVIEQAIETAALMLGSAKSLGSTLIGVEADLSLINGLPAPRTYWKIRATCQNRKVYCLSEPTI